MKLTIERSALLTSLSHVQSVVERRNTIPILANILLIAEDGSLGLTATDLDIAINEKVAANISTEGAITVPAHLLHDIIRKLPDGSQVELDYKSAEGRIYIHCGQSKFALACLPQDDFPVMETNQLPHNFTISASILKRLIDKTRFAISTEETRYYLNGIYLHTADTEGVPMLRAVATDGHRLARVETPLPADAEGMPGVIVPRKAVNEVLRLIDERDDNSGDMEIGFNSKYLLDITGQIDGDNARFLFADSGSPTIVRDGADDGALYVLMPMRV